MAPPPPPWITFPPSFFDSAPPAPLISCISLYLSATSDPRLKRPVDVTDVSPALCCGDAADAAATAATPATPAF